jgi:gluconolactonase
MQMEIYRANNFFVSKVRMEWTLDNEGNVYLTGDGVTVYNKNGEKIDHIKVPSQWDCQPLFWWKEKKFLIITASESVYTIEMRVRGVNSQSRIK